MMDEVDCGEWVQTVEGMAHREVDKHEEEEMEEDFLVGNTHMD